MENQKEMIEFVEWISKNVKGFENSTPDEIVTALNGMVQSEEGKKSLQDLFAKFKNSKQKFQFGGVIKAFDGKKFPIRRDTVTQHVAIPLWVADENGARQIGERRIISRTYPTYSFKPGDAEARQHFYTTDGLSRRIMGRDTIYEKRFPIRYTPAGNMETGQETTNEHEWVQIVPTSWEEALFNKIPHEIAEPEVEYKADGGRVWPAQTEVPNGSRVNIINSFPRRTTRIEFPDGGSTNQYIDRRDTVYTSVLPNGRSSEYFKDADGKWNVRYSSDSRTYGPSTDIDKDVDILRQTIARYSQK